jgi:PAS domain S-box-containing protein
MSIISYALNLLSAPPGGLVYHLVTLFAIEAGLGMALGQWQRTRQKAPLRIAVAFGGLLLMRLCLMLVALLAWQGFLDPATLVPPLERFFDTAGVVLLCWAFVFPSLDSPDLSRLFLIANLSLTTMTCLVLVPLWYLDFGTIADLNYNGYWQDIVWGIWKFLIICTACLILLWRASRERGLLLSVFTCLLVGSFLHQMVVWLAPHFYEVAHIAGLERLTNLVAFSLLAVAVYRIVIAEISSRRREHETVDEGAEGEVERFLPLLRASQKTSASLELPVVLDSAVEGAAQALRADMCAIAFPADNTDEFHFAAMYPQGEKEEDISLTLNEQPMIQPVVRRGEQIVSDRAEGDAQVMKLYALMGFSEMGPLLIQPLSREDDVMGMLILGNPRTKRAFSSSELQLSQTLASQITVALENARLHQRAQAKAEQLAWTLHNQEELLSQRRADLEAEAQKSREDAEMFAQRLYEAEMKAKRMKQEVKELTKRLHLKEKEALEEKDALETELRQKREEAQRLAQELEAGPKDVQTRTDLEAELNRKEEQIRQLAEELQAKEAKLDQIRTSSEKELNQAADKIKQLAEIIHRQKEGFGQSSALMESIASAMIVSNEAGQVVSVNPAAVQILGVSRSELLERPMEALWEDASWRGAIKLLLASAGKKGKTAPEATARSQKVLLKKDESITLQANLTSIIDGEGNFKGVVAVLHDVAAESEEQRAKDEFIASISQELRTPMTSITGYTDLLLGESVGTLADMQRKFLQRIQANTERMGSMLNDLIGVAAIDAGQLKLQIEPLDLAGVLEDTIAGARAQLEEKEIVLDVEVDENLPLVKADADYVHQIMTNLLSNACKCSPVGGKVSIRARAYERHEFGESDTGYLLVSVSDSGGGIAPEDQSKVFDRFYQAERPLIAGLGETGVGLSIVKALVEAHGGRIWVESETGVGSTFNYILPIADGERAR